MKSHCTNDQTHCKSRCFKIAVLAIAGISALGAVVMLLWNWLIPTLFIGAREVDYLQALGILLLSKILFGGFRGGCHGRWHKRREQWERLSPEEREQLKGEFKSRWGHWCGSTKADSSPPKDGPSVN